MAGGAALGPQQAELSVVVSSGRRGDARGSSSSSATAPAGEGSARPLHHRQSLGKMAAITLARAETAPSSPAAVLAFAPAALPTLGSPGRGAQLWTRDEERCGTRSV